MADTTVPEQDPWAAIADELERIAKDVRTLIGEPKPGCFDINIQPHNADGYGKNTVKNRPATAAAVDAVAKALLGKASSDVKMGDGSFHRDAQGRRGPIGVAIYTSIVAPDAVDPDEEIARLRAEVEQLRAERGLTYSREADDPTPVSPARVPLHTGAVTDEDLVDESGWRDETTGLVSGGLAANCPACGGFHADGSCF